MRFYPLFKSIFTSRTLSNILSDLAWFINLNELSLKLLPNTLHKDVVYVNTSNITHIIWYYDWYKIKRQSIFDNRFILDGGWDIPGKSMLDYKSSQQRFVEDIFVRKIPFNKTKQYNFYKERLLSGKQSRDFKTLEELEENYYKRLIGIFKDIQNNGYRTQHELQKNGKADGREIMVVIDRFQNLLLLGGRHRYAICKILGIKKIPIKFMGAHKHWVRACIKKYGGTPWKAVLRGIQALEAK